MSVSTEMRNPRTTHIDRASTREMLGMIHAENAASVAAVGEVLDAVALAVDAITEGMQAGGRLLYIGAGTSGRLGVLDAVECPPTFGVSPELVSGVIAGGRECMFRAAEGEEDDGAAGVRDLSERGITERDTVVGISAAGNAAYVAEALGYARSRGAKTIGLTMNAGSRLAREADIPIVCETGAEAITGSTRMKAGNAQKMILNMLSTCAMIKTGRVYENVMINLRPTNIKLRRRVIATVMSLAAVEEEKAVAALDAAEWDIRTAVDHLREGGA